jgi:acetoacetyl-CoA reductase
VTFVGKSLDTGMRRYDKAELQRQEMNMASKVAYVTGGMGGIGTAICQRLSKEGFKVIAGCGPSRDFKKWIDEQKAQGYTFYTSVGNVADWDSTVAAFASAK